MNQANLAKLFHNYIESYNVLTDAEHDELYKWRAVNHFQKHWNLEADEFGEMFKQAMEQSFNIVNNSIVQPANGIVFLCKQDKKTEEEVEDDYTLDTSKVKAFFVPAGTMIEVYATTLHYAPCQTSDKGFRCVVVLPEGTNGELSHKPENKSGEEKLLAAVNKWLIGHAEGGLPEGSFIGLKGENTEV